MSSRQVYSANLSDYAERRRQDELFERRMGCPERYLTGAIGTEDVGYWIHLSKHETGSVLMAQRGELEEARKRIAALEGQ